MTIEIKYRHVMRTRDTSTLANTLNKTVTRQARDNFTGFLSLIFNFQGHRHIFVFFRCLLFFLERESLGKEDCCINHFHIQCHREAGAITC